MSGRPVKSGLPKPMNGRFAAVGLEWSRSALRLETAGSTVIGCLVPSQATFLYAAGSVGAAFFGTSGPGSATTSTWNGRAVNGPLGAISSSLSAIRSSTSPNSER
jgi:hypothetical protein